MTVPHEQGTSPAAATTGMSSPDRRMVIGVFVVLALSVGGFSGYNFIVDAVAADLGATRNQTVLLRQLPNIGTLLVVFLVGQWGSRLGMRRVIHASAILMVLGYLLLLMAPVVPLATLGMLLASVGKQGIGVITVSLLGARLTRPDDRTTGFAVKGMAEPLGYLVVLVMTAVVMDNAHWRAVVALWGLMALAAALAARRLLPADEQRSATGEMWTPALAGLVLACLVQYTRTISHEGLLAPRPLFWLAMTAVAAVILWRLAVRLPQPTLDLSLLQHGGFRLLLIVALLLPGANLFYYFAVGIQRQYGYTATDTALLMALAQLKGMAGSWFARSVVLRLGLRRAGTLMLIGVAGALFLSTGQTLQTPVYYPVFVLCLFAFFFMGAGVVVTNAIMNLAPAGQEGSASSLRSAASQFGGAMGVALSAAVFFGAAQGTMHGLVTQRGGEWAEAEKVVQQLRGVSRSSEQVAEQFALPLDVVTTYNREWLDSQLVGFRAQGLLGGCLGLFAALLYFLNRSIPTSATAQRAKTS